MKTQEGITVKEICERIVEANILEKPDGSTYTPMEIWNYSSTGELFMIFEWYELACNKLNIENITLSFIGNNKEN